jgi:uncharacterized membrane protein YeaQ/YmgE (transglycosylase-associated protein family)
MSMPEIVGWVALGLVAGVVARTLVPGDDKGGCLPTILLGIAGSFVGGWLGNYVGLLPSARPGGTWVPSTGSLITASLGAVVLLALFRFLRR